MQHLQAPSRHCMPLDACLSKRTECLSRCVYVLFLLYHMLTTPVMCSTVPYSTCTCMQARRATEPGTKLATPSPRQLVEVARLGDLLAPMERGRTCHLQDLSVRCASATCMLVLKVTACGKAPGHAQCESAKARSSWEPGFICMWHILWLPCSPCVLRVQTTRLLSCVFGLRLSLVIYAEVCCWSTCLGFRQMVIAICKTGVASLAQQICQLQTTQMLSSLYKLATLALTIN